MHILPVVIKSYNNKLKVHQELQIHNFSEVLYTFSKMTYVPNDSSTWRGNKKIKMFLCHTFNFIKKFF
tara:strand:+ start:527 stop:730 length:204 start_codon:yes stop_codon:yes gene_type:complete